MAHSSVSPDLDASFSGPQEQQTTSEELGTPPSWYISTGADHNPAFQDVSPDTLPQLAIASVVGGEETNDNGLIGSGDHEQPVKLGMLWQILAERDRNATANAKIDMLTSSFQIGSASWDVVIIQALLLLFLIIISLLWAFCCKKKCMKDDTLTGQVVTLARKISNTSSKDLPPSYSKVDLTSIGLSIHDHFNPPPNYDPAMVDTSIPIGEWPLQLRTPRVSVSSGSSGPGSFLRSPRISVTSLASAFGLTPSASATELNPNGASGTETGTLPNKPPYTRRTSIRSLPQIPEALLASSGRKRSSKSDTGILMVTSGQPGSRKVSFIEIVTMGAVGSGPNRSRKASFVDELTGRSIREQSSDLEAILNNKLSEAECNGEIGEFVEQKGAENSAAAAPAQNSGESLA